MKIENYIIRYWYLTSDSLGEQGNKADLTNGNLQFDSSLWTTFIMRIKTSQFNSLDFQSPPQRERNTKLSEDHPTTILYHSLITIK